MKRPRGFTLIELLMSITITAIVAAMAYTGLDAATQANEGVSTQAERLQELNLAMTVLSRDIRQAQTRPIRNESGAYETAFSGNGAGDNSMTLTRSGWQNPTGRNRSKLQRLAYHHRDGKLLRESWDVLDRNSNVESYTAALIEGVEDFSVRFLAPLVEDDVPTGTEWLNQWEPQLSYEDNAFLPLAVEVNMTLADWGNIRRLYLVASYWPIDSDFQRLRATRQSESARKRQRGGR